MYYNPQDSKNYRGKVGTGLCRTCRSHRCIMTAYIPKYDRQLLEQVISQRQIWSERPVDKLQKLIALGARKEEQTR